MAEPGPMSFSELSEIDVGRLVGVGPKKLAALRTLGISTMCDLLMYYPRRYLDRTNQATIAQLSPGEEAMVWATVQSISTRRVRNNRAMVVAEVSDGSGRLKISFFNQAWRERQLSPGTQAVFYGKLEIFNGTRQITNPVVDLVGDKTGRILPIYPQSEKAGLSTWEIGEFVAQTIRRCRSRGFADPVPEAVLHEHGLISRQQAIEGVHLPDSMGAAMAARKRLVFDELLRIQISLIQKKRTLEYEAVGFSHESPPALFAQYLDRLDFELTGAQTRAILEIRGDLARPLPMHRLLQGDVGAGKTVVAIAALLAAVESGHQGALMAPTEVLAEQHFLGISRDLAGITVSAGPGSLFETRDLRVALLTGRKTAAERRRTLAELESGDIDLVIGTHALIQDAVSFRSLGVVVIDEQHRFGVEQRDALRTVNPDRCAPDVLVMTATPIPRTAAMTVYGDLDVSVLDELPPRRSPILTSWARTDIEVDQVWDQVRAEVAVGRQAYVVCPLIEESEKLEVASATETYERLALVDLKGLRLSLLHGKMASADKEAVMSAFRAGEVDVLVATTVIEVGVDVPNATIMVICDADRFGIAQLHQLRGRVGRGAHQSHCVLISQEPSADGEARIEALVASTDGFELAEIDLELRGEGTIMGARQKGQNDLRLASLRRDAAWVPKARQAAMALVDVEGTMNSYPVLGAEVALLLHPDDEEYLLKG